MRPIKAYKSAKNYVFPPGEKLYWKSLDILIRENANMAMSDFTTTTDYNVNANGTGTTNPTPKVKTKMAFDRVSTSITLVSPSTNVISDWNASQTYAVGTNIKYNGGYWQSTVAHTASSNFVADVQSGKMATH